jgi:hypothetical protein
MINRSIELMRTIRVKDCCKSPILEVGGQTIRKIGRAETLDQVELLQCIREYRAEFTLGRTLLHRKRVVLLKGAFLESAYKLYR